MSHERNNESLVVVANAIDLASKVILRVAGGAVAGTMNGERITPALLSAAVAAKFQTKFASYLENK
jgi:hypothetical protein